jgi:hypothetical protein
MMIPYKNYNATSMTEDTNFIPIYISQINMGLFNFYSSID